MTETIRKDRPFQGMTALVTGASGGIGAATALDLARNGAYVIVHYHSKHAEAEAILGEVRSGGGDGETVQADLGTREGTGSLATFVHGRTIDILVNNAGSLVARTRVLEFTEELWDQVMMLTLQAYFLFPRRSFAGWWNGSEDMS